jgi:hypothetical protein
VRLLILVSFALLQIVAAPRPTMAQTQIPGDEAVQSVRQLCNWAGSKWTTMDTGTVGRLNGLNATALSRYYQGNARTERLLQSLYNAWTDGMGVDRVCDPDSLILAQQGMTDAALDRFTTCLALNVDIRQDATDRFYQAGQRVLNELVSLNMSSIREEELLRTITQLGRSAGVQQCRPAVLAPERVPEPSKSETVTGL